MARNFFPCSRQTRGEYLFKDPEPLIKKSRSNRIRKPLIAYSTGPKFIPMPASTRPLPGMLDCFAVGEYERGRGPGPARTADLRIRSL